MESVKKARVFWRWSGKNINGLGFIRSVDSGHVTIELLEEVRRFNWKEKVDDVWPPGCRITVPKKGTSAWSKNNCYEEIV